jgi:hypothetical protein
VTFAPYVRPGVGVGSPTGTAVLCPGAVGRRPVRRQHLQPHPPQGPPFELSCGIQRQNPSESGANPARSSRSGHPRHVGREERAADERRGIDQRVGHDHRVGPPLPLTCDNISATARTRRFSQRLHPSTACIPHVYPADAENAGPAIVSSGFVGRSGGSPARRSPRRFFPHFAPPTLTCRFATRKAAGTADPGLTVEECGVQWSAVE